ncbi:Protein RTM1 [Paramyrothecium foliicola]|nr:Protein RTM1 [Paramyrothecium foliicola]
MAELKTYKGYQLWLYLPSVVAAAIFTALFTLVTAFTAWRTFKTRSWFCVAFVVGGLFEVIGYAARATARDKTDQLMPNIIQSVFILVAPALFAASVYMTLGRIIRGIGAESVSVIKVKWLTTIFVTGDVVSFVVQASGAGIMVTADSMKLGENIILGGLFVQIIVFGIFAVTAAIFHRRVRQYFPSATAVSGNNWERIMTMLYSVSILIMARSVFRVIEYAMGHDGYLLRNEWTLYIFDAVLMFASMVLFAWLFPGNLSCKSSTMELTERNEHRLDDQRGPKQLGQGWR